MHKNILRLYLIVSAAALLLFCRCTGERNRTVSAGEAVTDDTLLTSTYPKLYEALYSRDDVRLRPYLDHELIEVRKQAWRGLAHTPVDSLDRYIEKAKREKLEVAWFALSLHDFSASQLRDLEQLWEVNPNRRNGVSRVLGEQGDEKSLEFLIGRIGRVAGSSYEYAYALALGKLMTEYALEEERQLRLMRRAFASNDAAVTRAYLYGWYRENIQLFSSNLQHTMYDLWKEYGVGSSSLVDQYVGRILGKRVFDELTHYYNDLGLLHSNVQLAVELGQTVAEIEPDSIDTDAVRILLNHENPHVVQQTLQSLAGKIERASGLFAFIHEDLLAEKQTDPFVWLQALSTLAAADKNLIASYGGRLDSIGRAHSYLLPMFLEIHWRLSDPDRFLEKIESIVDEGDPLRVRYAIQGLADFWEGLEGKQKTGVRGGKMREAVFNALRLGDRAIAFAAQRLLDNKVLFRDEDFDRINAALSAFRMPEDLEAHQAFGRLYKQRFERRARPVIDSLAALGFASLNRSLAEQGWKVAIPGESRVSFRRPDWQRLRELGAEPVWILQTEKGEIRIRAHPLSAPATVSAIDSLTRAGAYDGVPFHRVVPNFVIQGGDVERADGFGGPGFVIPTEAGEGFCADRQASPVPEPTRKAASILLCTSGSPT